MNLRKTLFGVAAIGLSLTLAACGGGPSATPTPTDTGTPPETQPATPPADAGTVNIWVDETRTADFQELAQDFQAQTGITLNVIEKPSADLKTDFVAQVPTGEGPDLVVGAHDWTGDFVKNGVVAPVELGDKLDSMTPLTVTAFTMGGAVYGVPYAIENIALVRNNAMVQDTPATFDELIAQGKATEGADFPVMLQQGPNGDAYHMYPIQTSFGATVFKIENGEYTTELGMGGPAGEAFATYLQKLGQDGVVSVNIEADQAKQAFLDGKSPYIITGPWYVADFEAAGMDISVLPVPSAGGQPSAPFVGVQGVYLSSRSENALLANQFLDYMTSKDVQDKLFELGGRVPANAESAAAVDDPILAGFAEAGKEGQAMPAIPEMAAVWTFWGAAQAAILSGQATDPVAEWNSMVSNIEGQFGS
ncbi:MAG TPA: maltose ABC transporter substrate-binding protein [Arachnia sp.]|nr:maltose ABC transporter substrate-binding protein [Arachnia sp.]HMT86116.1 maltose ABC transporter substrate-binding protein [Arachnia sp.]